jgi:hypothetical protein
VGLWLGALPAFAGNVVPEKTGLLGLSREQLETLLPGAQRVRAPRRLSSGAVSQLQQADVLLGRAHFDETFYFAQQKLTQIEMVSRPDEAGADEFATLLAALKTELGPELAAADTASWVHGDADILLYRYGNTARPTVRLVIRQRQLVDAGEL